MKISKNCYIVSGLYFLPPWSVNAGFVVGEEVTLIIDTGCNNMSASTIFGYARCAKPENKIIVINTEKHLDHMGGNSFFKEHEADILGHYLINRSQEDFQSLKDEFYRLMENPFRKAAHEEEIVFSGSRIENPNILIDSDRDLDLGGITVKIVTTPGHTETNLSVFVPTDRVVFTGDLVVPGFIPNMEEGCPGNWSIWLNSLVKIRNIDPEILVPGHGEFLDSSIKIEEELCKMEEKIRKAINSGKAPTS